ncbi:unnamed protein product, partial [Sphacelaria rigidula]
ACLYFLSREEFSSPFPSSTVESNFVDPRHSRFPRWYGLVSPREKGRSYIPTRHAKTFHVYMWFNRPRDRPFPPPPATVVDGGQRKQQTDSGLVQTVGIMRERTACLQDRIVI